MDLYTLAFAFPRAPAPGLQTERHVSTTDNGLADVAHVVNAVRKAHSCAITYTKADHGKGLIFHLSGAYPNVLNARGMLLRDVPIQTRIAIRVSRAEVMNGSEPKAEFKRRLDEIGGQTHTRIVVTKSSAKNALPVLRGGTGGWAGLETERMAELVVAGPTECVEIARVRLLVLLDELSGLHAEALDIDQKLHPIIASRKRHIIQAFQQETSTNIYFPNPLHGLMGPKLGPMAAPSQGSIAAKPDANVVWVTGEYYGVQRAKEMLSHVVMHKSKARISVEATIVPRKLDWMLIERSEDIRTLMNDNGTFIAFPPVGSQTSQIVVHGDSRVNVNRTLRMMMQLSCYFYVSSFWLLPMGFNPLMPQALGANFAQMPEIITRIANTTGAEVVFKSNCFEVHGHEAEVLPAINLIFELDLIRNFHHEIRFNIELANEHRDFISGKKNGKINKIMQSTSAKVKFDALNDHNFLIELAGNDAGTLSGLYMLQEELPAEISFHVPEVYHKRIIGVGGKSIQKIMKKWGVYVKFSNADEFAMLGGYNENEDNVVARTPAKNHENLVNLKESVMEMVPQKDKDFVYEPLHIPRRYHRTLLGEKHIFIHDIEQKTNSTVRFPDKELAADIVTIFGPEAQVHIAAAMILEHVPFEAFLVIPQHPDVPSLCNSGDFSSVVDRIRRDYQVTIVPVASADAPTSSRSEHAFKFFCQKSNSDYLSAAREQFEQFLNTHGVQTYPYNPPHQRPDSFAEAFPHFPSKLLATPTQSDTAELSDSGSRSRTNSGLHTETPSYAASAYTAQEEFDEHEVFENLHDSLAPLPPSRGKPLSRVRMIEDYKRGSDSALEAKLRASRNAQTNRAISLDLGQYSLHHFQDAGVLPPDSPEGSADEADNAAPDNATSPNFPSVYNPPSAGSVRPQRQSQPPVQRAREVRQQTLPPQEEEEEEVEAAEVHKPTNNYRHTIDDVTRVMRGTRI